MFASKIKFFVERFFSRDFFNWLKKSAGLWFLLLVVLISFSYHSKSFFSIIGNFLQLLGVLFVIFGINSRLKKLKHPGFLASMVSWLKSWPLRSKSVVLNVDSVNMQTTTGGAFIVASNKLPDNFTLSDLKKYVDSEIEKLDNKNSSRFSENERVINVIKEDLKGVKKDYDEFKLLIEETFNGLHIKDFGKELFGAVAIIIGLFYSTVALFMQ